MKQILTSGRRLRQYIAAMIAACTLATTAPAQAPTATPSPAPTAGVGTPPALAPLPEVKASSPAKSEDAAGDATTPSPFSLEAMDKASREFWERTFQSTKDALENTRRLANGTVVKEQRRCQAAKTAAADCDSVAKEICAAKGFSEGRPFDTNSATTCPAPVRLGLRPAKPGECRIEQVLTAAICW